LFINALIFCRNIVILYGEGGDSFGNSSEENRGSSEMHRLSLKCSLLKHRDFSETHRASLVHFSKVAVFS